jgi:hypothetical protein
VTLQINTAKRWKLEDLAQQSYSTRKVDAWVYYCILCDEVLFISRRFVEAKGVQAAFDGICPDCGFGLENIMRCEHVQLPHTRAIYVNPKYQAPLLVEFPSRTFDAIRIQNARLPEEGKILTTGIAKLDKLVHLTTGQLIVFQGYPFSKSLAESLCVRVQLDHPIGLGSDVIFIDGGNCFGAYAVSEYAIEHRIDPKLALSRIHASRAFTYFQLASLLIEKLPSALMRYNSTFAIVSNITELFEDPEIKDKQEAYRIFQRMLRSLTAVTEITGSLVIATSSRQDINPFDTMLTQTAHATIRGEDHVTFTRFTLVHHKSLSPRKVSQRENCTDQFLEDYMER